MGHNFSEITMASQLKRQTDMMTRVNSPVNIKASPETAIAPPPRNSKASPDTKLASPETLMALQETVMTSPDTIRHQRKQFLVKVIVMHMLQLW